ncbi:MAG: DUF2723 domain-containing protein, partial [Candidatus Eisenbacteria bacterium]|nr:DUF2723 domain-containing protein [Candidatus Eisenbacteria bacterium]
MPSRRDPPVRPAPAGRDRLTREDGRRRRGAADRVDRVQGRDRLTRKDGRRPRAAAATFLAAALPLLAVYLAGLNRGLGTIDSGELAAAAHTLGIAHPPGYPLYTLLGRLAALVPLATILTRLHVVSALSTAAAAGCAALALRATLSEIGEGAGRRVAVFVFPVAGAWAWGLSPALWSVAVVNEVYGLHVLFLALCVGLGVLLMRHGAAATRHGFLLAYALGLGLSHHLALLFAVPALGAAVLAARRPGARVLLAWGALCLLGFSIHLYLPLRSLQEPLLDWGNPTDLERWFRHASGWQYRVWLFPGADFLRRQAIEQAGAAWAALGWILPPAAIWGAAVLLKRRAALALFWIILGVVGHLWASAYDIKDIDPYFAASHLAVAALGAAGAGHIAGWLRRG